MEKIEEIEKFYENPDPWGYRSNADDAQRKRTIIDACTRRVPRPRTHFDSVLDIGCGEGWITEHLPAYKLYGFECSSQARGRWPATIRPFDSKSRTDTSFELVTACGVLYPHYDSLKFFKMLGLATHTVICCNIKAWEVSIMSSAKSLRNVCGLEQVEEFEFPYREYMQKLRVFKKI